MSDFLIWLACSVIIFFSILIFKKEINGEDLFWSILGPGTLFCLAVVCILVGIGFLVEQVEKIQNITIIKLKK